MNNKRESITVDELATELLGDQLTNAINQTTVEEINPTNQQKLNISRKGKLTIDLASLPPQTANAIIKAVELVLANASLDTPATQEQPNQG